MISRDSASREAMSASSASFHCAGAGGVAQAEAVQPLFLASLVAAAHTGQARRATRARADDAPPRARRPWPCAPAGSSPQTLSSTAAAIWGGGGGRPVGTAASAPSRAHTRTKARQQRSAAKRIASRSGAAHRSASPAHPAVPHLPDPVQQRRHLLQLPLLRVPRQHRVEEPFDPGQIRRGQLRLAPGALGAAGLLLPLVLLALLREWRMAGGRSVRGGCLREERAGRRVTRWRGGAPRARASRPGTAPWPPGRSADTRKSRQDKLSNKPSSNDTNTRPRLCSHAHTPPRRGAPSGGAGHRQRGRPAPRDKEMNTERGKKERTAGSTRRQSRNLSVRVWLRM